MRTRETTTLSLPPAMLREVERARKIEQRTRSELIRQAIRTYLEMRRLPAVTPTPAERRALARGRAELRAGKFYTYDELLRRMDARHHAPRRKSS